MKDFPQSWHSWGLSLMCMLTICFLRFPLWRTTFWHPKQTNPIPSCIFAIIHSSKPEKLGFSAPFIHVSFTDINCSITFQAAKKIQVFNFCLFPQGVFNHIIRRHVKPSILCAPFPCAFWDCLWSWPPFHSVFLCSLDMWMPKSTLLSKLSPHWRHVRPPGWAKCAKIWFLAVSQLSMIFWHSLHFQVPPLATNSLSGSTPSIDSSLITTYTEIHRRRCINPSTVQQVSGWLFLTNMRLSRQQRINAFPWPLVMTVDKCHVIWKGVLVLQYHSTLTTLKRWGSQSATFNVSPPIIFVQEVLATDQTAPTWPFVWWIYLS